MNHGFPTGLLALDRIEAEGVEWSGTLPADPGVWDLEGVEQVVPPRVTLRAEAAGEGAVRVSGRLATVVRLPCRRCLAEVRHPVELAFDLRFEPGIDRWEESEGVYALDARAAELDPLPALREELLLALPPFPLCRPECPGLCPKCGAERAAGDCGCGDEAGDPRWDVLRKRLPRDPEEGETGRGSDDG